MEQAITISKFDKLWIEELYHSIRANKRPNYRYLRAKLNKQLPPDYNPNKIDIRYAEYRGQEITLQGVDIVDPKLKIVDKANQVIKCIKELLLEDGEKKSIETKEIVDLTHFEYNDVALILRLISRYGKFHDGGTMNQSFLFGFDNIRVQDDDIFDTYLSFSDIRPMMNNYYSKIFARQTSNELAVINSTTPNNENWNKFEPIFRSRIDMIDKNLCFVLMPFNEKWSEGIYKLIKETVTSQGFQCLRADNLHGQIVIEDIWIKICQAGFIIADVTNKNPNVMYEVGIAHTVGRPTFLLTQATQEIPFDFRHLRHIAYENTIAGSESLKKSLIDKIGSLKLN